MQHTIDEPTAIAVEARRISALIRSVDLTTPVPHLGRWKVRDVAAHLGGVHRWATRIVANRSMDGPSFTKSKLNGPELCDWFDAGAEELVVVLRANEAEGQCPNFNPGSPKTVGWWSRRQLHESVVHRWDIEHALGCTTQIDPGIAVDGIDEYLDVFVRTRGKQTLIAPLTLVSTQPHRSWSLSPAPQPGRVDVVPGESADATTQIIGPPETLLLVLWGRLELADAALHIRGDTTIAASLKT